MPELIINDENWLQHVAPVINGQQVSRGFSMRDYYNFPPASFDGSQSWDDHDLELIPRDAWDDLAADMERTKSRLSDIRMQSGPNGSYIPSLDQNGQGFCWAYSTTGAVMLMRAVQNLPYKRLSPHAVACKIYNFQDRGAWGALSLDFIRKNGVPDVDYWPEKSMSRQYDKTETWDNAKQYRAAEGWLDLDVEAYDANMIEAQIVTCLLNRIPVIHDFAWWSHSVVCMDYVVGNGRRILNSWTDSYGDKGMAVITGSKIKPMGACAVRSVVA